MPNDLLAHPDQREVVIIANPYSGAKENRAHVEELVAALRAAGLEPRPMWSFDELAQAAGEADFTGRTRCVIAAGGDGTFNRLLNCRLPVPLATFPLGNENLLARQFHYPNEPVAAAAAIAAGRTQTVDVARAGERLFCIVASAGFDADVVHRLERWRSEAGPLKRVTRLSYVPLMVGAVWNYGYPLFDIEADGRRMRGSLVLVFNVPQYCFGLPLAPDAQGDDGLLDYIVFTKPGRWWLTRYALAVLQRRQATMPGVEIGRAHCIKLTCEQPVPLEIDGEALGCLPIEIEVMPSALRLITP